MKEMYEGIWTRYSKKKIFQICQFKSDGMELEMNIF